jgi:hypothetical protein
MRQAPGQGRPAGCRERGSDCKVNTLEQGRRRRERCLMRSGEAENAVRARGNSGIASGLARRILSVMQAQLERRSSEIGARRDRQAERDQQSLCGNGEGRNRANERPPKTLGTSANAANADHVKVRSTPASSLEPPSRKSTRPQPVVNTKRASPPPRQLHFGRMRMKA